MQQSVKVWSKQFLKFACENSAVEMFVNSLLYVPSMFHLFFVLRCHGAAGRLLAL